MTQYVQPDGWPRPSGFSNGVVAEGRILAIAGQIAWDERRELCSDDFFEQAQQALRNVMVVLAAAGGNGGDIIRMTWYVTDKHEYLRAAPQLSDAYKTIVGAYYPAMTLVQVAALLEDRAKVEIEATAVLG